jgi:hypothetical protein
VGVSGCVLVEMLEVNTRQLRLRRAVNKARVRTDRRSVGNTVTHCHCYKCIARKKQEKNKGLIWSTVNVISLISSSSFNYNYNVFTLFRRRRFLLGKPTSFYRLTLLFPHSLPPLLPNSLTILLGRHTNTYQNQERHHQKTKLKPSQDLASTSTDIYIQMPHH